MLYVYEFCALVGGTVLVCQFVMTLLGLHDDHDLAGDTSGDLGGDIGHDGFDHDGFDHGDVDHGGDGGGDHEFGEHHGGDGPHHGQHDAGWLFRVITFRTVIAALTFFGLVGLAGSSAHWPPLQTLVLACLAGGGAMFGVHAAMQQLNRLRTDGTVRVARAVGKTGTVYLRIPGQNGGCGKIQLGLQDRTVELQALTDGAPLPTGTRVVVVEVIGADTVRVAPCSVPSESVNG